MKEKYLLSSMERVAAYEAVDEGSNPLGDAIIDPYSNHTYNVYVVGSIPTFQAINFENRSIGRSVLFIGSRICKRSSVGRAIG